jgi:hypothetical protein
MKELIEGLLFDRSWSFSVFPCGSSVLVPLSSWSVSSSTCPFNPLIHEGRHENSRLLLLVKNKAEEIKEAERARQEAITDAEWNARFVWESQLRGSPSGYGGNKARNLLCMVLVTARVFESHNHICSLALEIFSVQLAGLPDALNQDCLVLSE